MIFFAILIAMVIGVFVGLDAEKRGMSGIGWGIGVAAFMIVVLPLYLIVRNPRV